MPCCPICYEKLPRISRTLPCGHTFHFKCLNMWEKKTNKKTNCYNCPYCRKEYSVMKLRNEKIPEGYTTTMYRIKKNFIKNVKYYLNKLDTTPIRKEKIEIAVKLFEFLIEKDNINLLKKQKKEYIHFVPVVLSKTVELKPEVESAYLKENITDLQLKNRIYTVLDKCNIIYKNI